MERRNFLKVTGCALVSSTIVGKTALANTFPDKHELCVILIDTNKCIGCRNCETECAAANGLPEPDNSDISDRKTSETQWTAVSQYSTDKGDVYVKKQCMHCIQAACATACLTVAMEKQPQGPVTWNGSKCMGCRYCMISCPFDIPKFEYHSANPKIQKCQMCFSRLNEGKQPACVENCPEGALLFGKRSEIINIARKRIIEEPDKYINHIYGENEVGGTSVLYLTSVPFEKLGFRTDLGTKPYPEYTKEFLYGVPIVLTIFPAFLLALSNATKRDKSEEGGNGL